MTHIRQTECLFQLWNKHERVLIITEEVNFDLDSEGGCSLSSGKACRENILILTEMWVFITSHWSPFVRCIDYNKSRFKFIDESKQTEHSRDSSSPNRINFPSYGTTALQSNVLLTLRRLMSYIYMYMYMEHPFLMFLDHTQRRSTVGRTPLDE